MIYDLRDLSHSAPPKADVCIIGAGAAGLAIALEFRKSRHVVAVLEGGGPKFEEETQRLNDVVNVGEPIRETLTRIRAFGGTLNVWGGAWKLLDEIDFEKRDWVPYSGWPISYTEIAKYWSIAASRYDLPPPSLYSSEHCLANVKGTDGAKLINRGTRFSVLYKVGRPFNFKDEFYQELKTSPNIHIYLHANVTRLQLNESCKIIEHVKARSLDGASATFAAKHFILAAGGIENAALLLNSRDKMNGVGNQNDLVGRFYMDHPKGDSGVIIPFNKKIRLPNFWGSTSNGQMTIGISPTQDHMEKESLLNHWIRLIPVYRYQELLGHGSVNRRTNDGVKGKMPPLLQRWFKKVVLSWPALGDVKYIRVHTRLEQAPNPNSRVYLSGEKDILGNEKVALDWKIGSSEKTTMLKFHDTLRGCFANIGRFVSNLEETDRWPIRDDACHHLGTTRMGLSDKEAVVDKDCKVFGVENLFIAGSSVFPTGGNANPTFSIIALSIRLADHLRSKL